MKQKRRREAQKEAVRLAASRKQPESVEAGTWPGERLPYLWLAGIVLVAIGIAVIYGQTVRVPTIDYEDPFYLVYSPYVHVNAAFSRLDAVWTEPYFANFHPVTTTTWLVDRALADRTQAFDALPFRVAHLFYAVLGASLLLWVYRRIGIPAILAVLGAVIYAVHPVHVEVVAWLSARKDLVSLVFILLSFLAWLWAREASSVSQWRLRHAIAALLVLLAILSKPVAVILPVLFVAYEFCSAAHAPVTGWRWANRQSHPLLTRVLALTAIFVIAGGVSSVIFRAMLAKDAMHGGWLIAASVGLMLLMLAVAPSPRELSDYREGTGTGVRVLGPPLVVLSAIFGAGAAWTVWAQQQVGAIKGGLTLVPTLNQTFQIMLDYVEKAFVPVGLSASYAWMKVPYVSAAGIFGTVVVSAAIWLAVRLAGSPDRNRRLIAFGIFWFFIALIPVSNLISTSTKMADRYLFVPTAGAILVVLALAAAYFPASRRNRSAVCGTLLLVAVLYTSSAYARAEVWSGKTVEWNSQPQPGLSLWTTAVDVDPGNMWSLTNLGLAYLHLNPPEADKALVYLNQAVQVGESNQSNIADNYKLILSPVYEALADAHLTRTTKLEDGAIGSAAWQEKKAAYTNAVKYFGLALKITSGFASSDARVLSRLAEACSGEVSMITQEAAVAAPEAREPLMRQRDELQRQSEESVRHAMELLTAGNVPQIDPNYRTVVMERGNIVFAREAGASNQEKFNYYREALARYQEAAALFPDDPRPLLNEGLCYERLTAIAQSPEERRQDLALGEAALRKALTLNTDSPDYNMSLPYRALASLYSHVNDFHAVLDALKKARQATPAASAALDRDIHTVEQYLAKQPKNP